MFCQSLIGQSDLRSLPTEDDIANVLYSYEIEPYVVKRDGSIITSLTDSAAVILINSYCSTLMASKFVQLVPVWKLYKVQTSQFPLFKVLQLLYYIVCIFTKPQRLLHEFEFRYLSDYRQYRL